MLSLHHQHPLLDQTVEAALALSRRLGQPLHQRFRLPQQDAERRLRRHQRLHDRQGPQPTEYGHR